jgi:Kyakuja-Dileera-Zisupton transposase
MNKATLKRLSQAARERMSAPSLAPPSSSSKINHRRSRAKFPIAETIAQGPSGDITAANLPYHPASGATQPPSEPQVSFVPLSLDDAADRPHPTRIHIVTDTRSRHARAKEAAAIRWNHVVIPSLIPAFMLFERERLLPKEERTAVQIEETCRCGKQWKALKIICVYFEHLEHIELHVCGCPSRTAARQLVLRGLFPCAPLHPSLAVSIDMLEFVAELFVQQAPNERAWAATLENFLRRRGFKFAGNDSLRRRFTSALAQYQVLVRVVDQEMSAVVNSCRGQALSSNGGSSGTDSQAVHEDASDSTSPAVEGSQSNIDKLDVDTPIPERKFNNAHNSAGPYRHGNDEVPSLYLQSCCPLCFGGSQTVGLALQAIVCIDANFQLKRNRDKDLRKEHKGETGSRDPLIVSPCTVLLDQSRVDAMEARVNVLRPPKSQTRAGQKRKAHEVDDDTSNPLEDDTVEPGLDVPNSVLDGCEKSFIAADGDRIKASTQYFDDTGVMACLCRHDQPLYLANMRTAGEKQFYAFALMDALLRELPSHWRVGLLYDIACQIHRSLLKWDFIPEWEGRIEFGVSVFHAYGHQWTCQLWYHPRKSEKWGLSDGEGCERFWSQMKRLISGLRVTGYHRRLFILDIQVEHITKSKLVTSGRWLKDRVNAARKRVAEGEDVLDGRSVHGLIEQFKDQKAFQSKPAARQSKNGGAALVDRIISLRNTKASLKERLKELSAELESLVRNPDTWTLQEEINDRISQTRRSIARVEGEIATKTQNLRLTDFKSFKDLQRLKKSAWLNKQLNIRIVLDQLLVKLRARKFELANLDRGHTSRELDNQHRDHVEKATKGRERGIQATIKAYECLRKDMMMMRGKDGVAQDAYIPPEITTSVYKLDVDEGIWLAQSTEGLAQFPGGVVPPWLSDTSVRVGIRAAQEVVNSQEELKRCAAEHSNLRQWVETEYLATRFVFDHSTNVCVKHFALQKLHHLFDLLSIWRKDFGYVLFEDSVGSVATFLPDAPPPIPGMDAWNHAEDDSLLVGLDEGCGGGSDVGDRWDIGSDIGSEQSALLDEEQLDFGIDVDIDRANA